MPGKNVLACIDKGDLLELSYLFILNTTQQFLYYKRLHILVHWQIK